MSEFKQFDPSKYRSAKPVYVDGKVVGHTVRADELMGREAEPAAQPKPDAGTEERAREQLEKEWLAQTEWNSFSNWLQVELIKARAEIQQERNRVARECEEIAMDADTNHDASQQIRTLYPKAFEEQV